MDLPSKHVLHLSKRIGARGAGSDGEAAAASYVLNTFDEFDIEVDLETFSCWKSDYYAIIILYLLAILSYFLYRYNYVLSLLVLILVFLVFQMETYGWAIISKLLPRSNASNVIGRVRPTETSKHRVVLVANYDTAKSSPFGRRLVARMFRAMYVISFICIVLLVLLSAFGLAADLTKVDKKVIDAIWLASSPLPAYLFLMLVLFSSGELWGRYSPGANDNASGVGVMLSLMHFISEKPLRNTDVFGVATARGFAGGRGMVTLLKRHRRQLKKAFIVNLDHVGADKTNVVTREGVMLGFHCSRKLKRLAIESSKESEDIEIGKGRCRVKKSDAMVSLVRGYRAITVGGLRGGSYYGWRNRQDTFDCIDRDSLDRSVELVRLLIERIDSME